MLCHPDTTLYGKKMKNIFKITSIKNDKVKKIIKLRNKNKRDKYSLFLIEGYRELLRASVSDIKIDSLYFCKNLFLKNNEYKLIESIHAKGSHIYDVDEEIFQKISYRDRPDGLIAIANSFNNDFIKLEKIIDRVKNPLLVVLEGIEKPGNLGTILRTCDAVGVDAIIVADPKTDIFNPNVVRASIGTLFSVPIFVQKSENIISFLKKKNIEIISTSPSSNINYLDENFKNAVAITFGAEQTGLSDIWMKKSTKLVKIPMFGEVDSLNVATSTTVLLYEAIRQRKFS